MTGGGNSYISKSFYNRYDLVKALAITSISDTVTCCKEDDTFMPYIVPSYWHWKPTTAEVSELVSRTTSTHNSSKVISVPFCTPFTINLPGVVVAMWTGDFSLLPYLIL
jgi:hypothetical protein